MPRVLALDWFLSLAADEYTRVAVKEIAEWQEVAFRQNNMQTSTRGMSLKLGQHTIHMEACGAVATLEVYQEIFREHSHFHHPAFSGAQARTVIDLGANAGFYTMRVKEGNPHCKVLCLEPNPYLLPFLQRNFAGNNLTNVDVVGFAAGPHNTTIPFDLIRQVHSISGRTLRESKRHWVRAEIIETVMVQSVSIEHLMYAYQLHHIDLLKIDVEGMEQAILEDPTFPWNAVERIVVEVHDERQIDLLKTVALTHGFDLVGEDARRGEAGCCADLYFIRNQYRQ